MKKNIFLTIFSTIISVLASLFIYNLIAGYRQQRDRDEHTLNLAGKPESSNLDKLDELQNSEMIGEGSQFGVQYYDKHKDIE